METEFLRYFLINFVNDFSIQENSWNYQTKGQRLILNMHHLDNWVLLGVLWITVQELLSSVGTKSKKMEHPVVVQEEGSTPSR